MRIPPYYRKPSWQRFFAGMVIGAAISWCVFLYMHGVLIQEKTAAISTLEQELEKEKRNVKIWQDDYKALNKKNQEQLTIQDIHIQIANKDKYKLDTLAVYETEENIKEYLNFFLAKDIEFVFQSRDLITKMIENKVIPLNGKRYRLKIQSMIVYTTVNIQIELHLDE